MVSVIDGALEASIKDPHLYLKLWNNIVSTSPLPVPRERDRVRVLKFMKYIKARKYLALITNPPIIITGILLFCYASHAIITCFYAFWMTTACVLFLIVTPLGNQRLAQNAEDAVQRLPTLQWFFSILILELAMLGVYCGISLINGEILPMNRSIDPHLLINSLHTQLLHYGLFPWNLYALIAVGMGVSAYREKIDAHFSQLSRLFARQNPQGFWSLSCNIGARRLTLFAISSTLLFMTLFFISFILSSKIYLATGFQTGALLTTLILLTITFTQPAKKYINRIFSRHISTKFSFPIFCVSLGLMILMLSMLATGLTQQTTAQTPPLLIARLIHFNEQTAWTFFSILWWIFFTPLASGVIARVSKGYQIRTVLIGVLALPITISAFFILTNYDYFPAMHFPDTLTKIAALVSFLILLPMLVNHHNTSNAILSYFPKNGLIKHRDSQPFFQRIVQLTIALLYFYLTIGINGISLLIFALNYTSILILLITGFMIIKQCYRTRN